MAVLFLPYLKTLFETFDKPTEQDFSDLIDTLSTTLNIIPYTISGVGDVWSDVNFSIKIEHEQKQLTVIYHKGKTYLFDASLGTYGYQGIQTTESHYVELVASQFTDAQYVKLIESITSLVTVESSTGISQLEKGLSTEALYSATVNHEDVTIVSIKLNGVSQSIQDGITTVTNSQNIVNTKTYTLIVSYTRLGIPLTYTDVRTIPAYIPQYAGLSATIDYDADSVTTIILPKLISSESNLEHEAVINGTYVWFILNDDTKHIHDQNGLLFVDGGWASNYFFIKKAGTIILDNGDVATTTFYRSLTTLDSKGINFKFKSV